MKVRVHTTDGEHRDWDCENATIDPNLGGALCVENLVDPTRDLALFNRAIYAPGQWRMFEMIEP